MRPIPLDDLGITSSITVPAGTFFPQEARSGVEDALEHRKWIVGVFVFFDVVQGSLGEGSVFVQTSSTLYTTPCITRLMSVSLTGFPVAGSTVRR